jgi:hypothetical protein
VSALRTGSGLKEGRSCREALCSSASFQRSLQFEDMVNVREVQFQKMLNHMQDEANTHTSSNRSTYISCLSHSQSIVNDKECAESNKAGELRRGVFPSHARGRSGTSRGRERARRRNSYTVGSQISYGYLVHRID